jgi:glycosyltransferase involved in cell wall biosynthesis
MPKVSVIIPTHNRPELLPRAIRSILTQTYQDFDIIVVDDGLKERAENIVATFGDPRIFYLKNDVSLGGSGARNRGIREARGTYIAFLDDDDEWLPEKLALQMSEFSNTSPDVGFCFTAAYMETDHSKEVTTAKGGVNDLSMIALRRFKGFLTTTLIVKRAVFDDVGFFDEALPSHQEAELIVRITRKYKGLGINRPLVVMNIHTHEHIGGDLSRRIRGKELVLEKHAALYAKHPRALASQYFWLALWCRDLGQFAKAKTYFLKAFFLSMNPRYFLHWWLMLSR